MANTASPDAYEQSVVHSRDGTAIEVRIRYAGCQAEMGGSRNGKQLVVLQPAHPLLGGSVEQLMPLAHALSAFGCNVAILSFRGTGGLSGGSLPPVSASVTLGDDLLVACASLKHRSDASTCIVLGYSFGAAVAARAVILQQQQEEHAIDSAVLLALPYGSYKLSALPFGALSAAIMRNAVEKLLQLQHLDVKAVLFIFPAYDAITPPDEVESLRREATDSQLTVETMGRGGHFDAVMHVDELLSFLKTHNIMSS